jgi:hypothetical protein
MILGGWMRYVAASEKGSNNGRHVVVDDALDRGQVLNPRVAIIKYAAELIRWRT